VVLVSCEADSMFGQRSEIKYIKIKKKYIPKKKKKKKKKKKTVTIDMPNLESVFTATDGSV
jgi:predicted transcriptional regulator